MAINNKTAFLLDQIMSELQIKYARRILDIPASESGAFEDYPNYTWSMESKDFEMPDLRSVLVSGDGADDMTLLIIDKLTEYLNQSVKELKVTVTYTIGKSSVDYSATTFMVDYNQPLPIGGVGAGGVGLEASPGFYIG
jgi:general secretion pathway protein I